MSSMKISILFLSLFLSSFVLAQKNLPVIKASSKKAFIIEGEDDRRGWNLSPGTGFDVFTITKSIKPKRVKFYTDSDSIKAKIKPNENSILLFYSTVKTPAIQGSKACQ